MKCGIYSITNKINGLRCVGSTRDFSNRIRKHRSELRRNKHGNPKLQNAWNSHGEENFFFEFIEEVEETLLLEVEQIYLDDIFIHKKYEAYNLNPYSNRGPDTSGIPLSEEHKQKISAALAGTPRSPETRAKISQSHMGITPSPEARERMSEAKKGSTPWNKGGSSWAKGQKFSDEHKKKMSETARAQRIGAKITLEQQAELLEKYATGDYSQSALAKEYNLTQSGVSRLIKRNS